MSYRHVMKRHHRPRFFQRHLLAPRHLLRSAPLLRRCVPRVRRVLPLPRLARLRAALRRVVRHAARCVQRRWGGFMESACDGRRPRAPTPLIIPPLSPRRRLGARRGGDQRGERVRYDDVVLRRAALPPLARACLGARADSVSTRVMRACVMAHSCCQWLPEPLRRHGAHALAK